MKRRVATLACSLVLYALSVLAGEPIEVVDDADHRITLARPAQRIISLAPHVTELLFAAGAGDKIVAVVSYSDYPPAAQTLPRVGSHNRFDVERVLAHEPDLVVGWRSGNPAAALERLRTLGLNLYLTEPRSLDSIADNLERLGRLAGTVEQAAAAAADFRERHRSLQARFADRRPLSVFYQIWDDPLMTINGEHLISAIIRSCGGRNVFADLPAIAPRVSVEAVLARDPEVVVASGVGTQRPQWLDDWERWPELRAVRRNNLYFIPPGILQRHSPRVLDGMEHMCRALEDARA